MRGICLLFLFLLTGCEQLVNPQLESIEPILVVEAWLTTRKGDTFVRLTKTLPYNTQDAAPTVSNATVILKDDQDGWWLLTEKNPGYYSPAQIFEGKVGKTYSLEIVVEQKVIRARSFLPSVPFIDSLKIEYKNLEPPLEDGFYLVTYFKDPPEENYYMWQIFRNGERIEKDKIFLLEDKEINGQKLSYIFYEKPINPNDAWTIVFFSLNKSAFDYYKILK
ncbi:MAG: DUF4249 domain-containing protein, partial [Flammeovirgaceae bacterium]|nr:DUF4249 domain-containing protein [Flammeovirgaceae bacterium]MDW8287658.1 DUF4249 domain-containing protein [Flammeovirgaceae bacterium]